MVSPIKLILIALACKLSGNLSLRDSTGRCSKICASAVAFAVIVGGLNNVSLLCADDWPQWRGPQRNGISLETNWSDTWPESGPKILWRAQVGTGFSSIAVANGRLFTMGNSSDVDSVWCLNALTGKKIWQHSYPADLDDRFFEGGPTSTPVVDGDRVYVLSRQGLLVCLQIENGEMHWSKNIAAETAAAIPGWGFAGSPVIHNNLLLLNVGSAGTAVNKHNGEVQWKSGAGEAGYMTPLPYEIGQRNLILVASGKAYSAVEVESGEVLWQHRWLTTYGCNAADPIVKSHEVFLSSGYNRGSALLTIAGKAPQVVWTTKEFQNQLSSSLMLDGFIYGVDGNDTGERNLKCIEFATGRVVWSIGGFGSATMMSANGRLIILSDDGELVVGLASRSEFRPTARAKVLDEKCWTVPVLAHGLIYCRSTAGEIVCVDLRR